MTLDALPTLKATIDAFGLATKKSLGQHFLLDGNITRRIVSYAGDLNNHTVIEVGPGPGGLTRALLASDANRVIVIEKDVRCLPIMAQLKQATGEKLQIIEGDALTQDYLQFSAPRKIVANLPYNVGTELLLGWLEIIAENANAFASLTLMFQKEVAERIAADHGCKAYGRLSVYAQWLCEVRYDMELPPGAFSPPPKVSSAVITLIPRKKPLFDVKKETLEKLLSKAFGQRRKMLRGALKGLVDDVEGLLFEANIDGRLRAEQLDIAAFGQLATALERRNKVF